MTSTGTEKYSRIILILVKGGTKITRTLFEKRVEYLSPAERVLTVNEFVLKNRAAILQEKAGTNKQFIYFPRNGGETDIGIWDMPMFCYILIKVCDLTAALCMYVRKLQKIRNKLSHMTDPSLQDVVYEEYIEKVDCCFQKCLEEINDRAFTAKLDELVRSLKEGPLVLDDIVKPMHTFYKMEIQQREILEKIDKGTEEHTEQMNELISQFKLFNSRMPPDILVDVPEIGVAIEVKQCSAEKEKHVVGVLITIFNDILSSTLPTLEKALPNSDVHKLRDAVEQTLTQFLRQGKHVVRVQEKCIMLMIKCTSPATLVELLEDYRTDNLTRQLSALEKAIRTVDGCADVKLEVAIYKDEFWRTMRELVVTLKEHVSPRRYVLQSVLSHSSQTKNMTEMKANGICSIQVIDRELPSATTIDSNTIKSTLNVECYGHLKQPQNYFESGLIFENAMEYIEREVGNELEIGNLSIKAHLLIPDTKREIQPCSNPHQDTSDDDLVSITRRKEMANLQFTTATSGQLLDSIMYVEMEISGHIQNSCAALSTGHIEEAKTLALQALTYVDKRKEALLKDPNTSKNEEQLASWYMDCSHILRQVGEHIEATRCYYIATVFTTQWDYDEHLEVSDLLWGVLVISELNNSISEIYRDVKPLLEELDMLAQLAEKREKWSVCAAIDEDTDGIHYFFSRLKRLSIASAGNIIKEPDRRVAKLRSARCYLSMGLHQDTRKTCHAILCSRDYDDSEAFEIWARSLYQTKNVCLALAKCKQARKYCQTDSDKQRLEKFQSEIEEQLANEAMPGQYQYEADPEWLEDTNFRIGNTIAIPKSTSKQKTKHKRPKARDRSQQNISSPRLGQLKLEVGDTLTTIYDKTKHITTDIVNIQPANDGTKHQRHTIVCSTTTAAASCASSFGTDNSDSDSDSSEDSLSFSDDPSSRRESADIPFIEEEISFYDQSIRNEQIGTSYEKLLEMGVQLSQSYLIQFEDKHPEVLSRNTFYPSFLDKYQLEQKISKNPQKYVKCVIQFETSHEACCTPIDSSSSINRIEISGRSKIGQVFNEDEVVVEILDNDYTKDKRYGEVIGVWNKTRHKDIDHPVFICRSDDKEYNLVRPLCNTIPKIHVLNREITQKYKTPKERAYKIEVYEYDEEAKLFCNPQIKEINPAEKGSYLFLVAYISWGQRHIYPRGAIIGILPSVNSMQSGMRILNLQHKVPTLYEQSTVNQVSSMTKGDSDEPDQVDLDGRTDLTGMNIFTMGDTNTEVLNNALSVEKIDGGYKVGVHVSDVSMLVEKDSPIDREAKCRMTTFYTGLTKQRHMLPEPLSLNMCSLLPSKKRLTISTFMYITNTGLPMQMCESNFSIVKSYVRSKRHVTFAQAQDILVAQSTKNEDEILIDIKTLFKIASEVRTSRLGKAATFAIDEDLEGSHLTEENSKLGTTQNALDEFLIMANKKVAERLLRVYAGSVPLLYQPPLANEDVEKFLKQNSQYIDIHLKLQGKQIGPKRPNFKDCLVDKRSSKTVMIAESIWNLMSKTPKKAAQYLRRDHLHPLHSIMYQHWLSIQKPAEYIRSGRLKEPEANQRGSVTFTSPISSYYDLIIHRLIHAAVFKKIVCPYEKVDIDRLCIDINSMRTKARDYQNGCRLLALSIDIKHNPMMVSCFVDQLSDRGLKLISPKLRNVSSENMELAFNLLEVADKPELFEDKNTHWNAVKIVWKKRLYDFYAMPEYRHYSGYCLNLNPHKDAVFIPVYEYAKMLKYIVEEDVEDLSRAVTKARVSSYRDGGLDDVSTECFNTLQIKPRTTFSMTFSRGQQIMVQMTAKLSKGMMTPKLMLYNMTNNVKICLQHAEDPILYLYRYATRTTLDQYDTVEDYLDRWLPIMLMESATGAVRNEESYCISNVTVHFTCSKKGKFVLGLAECEARNIEFSGTVSDDDKEDDTTSAIYSYDWLCLKTTMPNSNKLSEDTLQSIQQLDTVWVGHADITKVRKSKHAQPNGKITVSFKLHKGAPEVPHYFKLKDNQKFSVEILRKTEVDRRTESFIKMLPSVNVKNTLAAQIALNKPIPALDKNHIAKGITRDLHYDSSNEDLRRKQLPQNNEKQQEAVDKALTSSFSLIQGPPGTGKTNTAIKLIYLFNKTNEILQTKKNPRKQVLFCGPSNTSVDLVAKWMLKRMGDYRPNFVRVYGRSTEAIDFPIPGRTFHTKRSTRQQRTPPALYPVALHHLIRQRGKKHSKEINKYDQMFKDSNYEPMPLEVKAYVHLVREASIDEIRKHDVIVCTTAVGSNPKVLEATRVYQVIVDEAGMCPEPQCLVPIIATKAKQVVLIGDHLQLRPIIMCREASDLGLNTSLFERYARTNSSINVQFTMLEEQYRMNPQICKFPSELFYNDRLRTKPGLWCDTGLDIWIKSTNASYPFVFVHIEGEERMLTVSTEDGNDQSKSNASEVEHVAEVYSYLLNAKHCNDSTETIQILTQYNAQSAEIKRKLKSESLQFDDENVSTVVSSQGGEWDYVIFSTVRSLPTYKIERNPTRGWCIHNLGFITDRNQVNVALTRARKGLFIIGNKNLLACDTVWKQLLEHYDVRGCVKTKEEFPPNYQWKEASSYQRPWAFGGESKRYHKHQSNPTKY